MKLRIGLIFLPAVIPALLAQGPAARPRAALSAPNQSSATAAGPPLDQPLLGFLARLDGSELRAIIGIPGAAIFGDPLALPAGLSAIYVAPGHRYAITVTGGAAGVMPLDAVNAMFPRALRGAITPDTQVVFSPRGSAAVLYSQAASRIQVVSGLPDSPAVSRDLALSGLPDPIQSMAVDDGGVALLAGTSGGAVYLLTSGAGPRFIERAQASAIAFFPGSLKAAVFDGAAGAVTLIQDARTASYAGMLADNLGSAAGPGFLQSTRDGRTLLAGSLASTQLWQVDVATGAARGYDTPAALSTLDLLRAGNAFLISTDRQQPAWLFAMDGTDGHIVFVPAPGDGAPLSESTLQAGQPDSRK